MEDLQNLDIEKYIDTGVEMIISYAPQLILALLTLFIGLWVINRIVNSVDRALSKKSAPTLTRFVISLASIGLKVLLIISVAGMIGIETTSFIAVLGAAGLAIGLAMQGNLANFASGVLILVFKPFKVGDYVEAGGVSGTVKEIQIFTTILNTVDNRRIIIPNSNVTGGAITNFSAEPTRRVDLVFGISYEDDIDQARALLERLISEDTRILPVPAHQVVVSELADSSVNLTVRVWCNSADYWGIHFDLIENAKKAMDREGISIPFPQSDVHIHQKAANA